MSAQAGITVEFVRAGPGIAAPISASTVRGALREAAAIAEVAARLPAPRCQVTIRLTGEAELRRLNQRFLGEDHPTDVLSFPAGEPRDRPAPPPGGRSPARVYLGDLAVSWPAVIRQAEEFGHPATAELALLLVHGLLHLLGWDHVSAAQEAEMSRLTRLALAAGGTEIAGGRL